MPTSPTQACKDECEARGWIVDDVERWIPRTNIRKDLWGVFDLEALDPENREIYLIQVTSRSNHSSRVKKVKAWQWLDRLPDGVFAEVWSWGELKAGWTLKVTRL